MSFNYKDYKLLYQDLNQLSTEDELINHYINHGITEGRKISITNEDYNYINNVDWLIYMKENPDLNIFTKDDAWKHWLTHGKKEGRNVIYKKNYNDEKKNELNKTIKITNDITNLQKSYDDLKVKYDKLTACVNDQKDIQENIENLKKIENSIKKNIEILKNENDISKGINSKLKIKYDNVLEETNTIINQNNKVKKDSIITKENNKLCDNIFDILFFDQYRSYQIRELLFSPKTIYGVYYIRCKDDYLGIVKNQIFFLKEGLFKITNKILVFITCYNEDDCEELEHVLSDDKFVLFKTKHDLNENYAFDNYYKYLEIEDYYLYYFHSCLDTKIDQNEPKTVITKWKNLLNFYTLKLFDLNIQLLDKYDVLGINISKVPYLHFYGNFWWSKSSYLNKLKKKIYIESDSFIMNCEDNNCLSLNKIKDNNDLLDIDTLSKLSRIDILNKSTQIL